MADVRLAVRQVRSSGRWVAVLQVPLPNGDERAATVGTYPTWGEALTEGCVAGRLQAAGISWGMPDPDMAPLEPGQWGEVSGTGEGQALPPLLDDAYPPGAVPLEELPVDAVGRSLPSRAAEDDDPGALTFGAWRAASSTETVEPWNVPGFGR